MEIEIWADSFHEGNWCCDNICKIAKTQNITYTKSIENGFIPTYTLSYKNKNLKLIVYGSYKSWSPIPDKIKELIEWGKPDFIAYDKEQNKILFAVEETAATPTGNQAMQRCERQYGSARFHIPYWYLISEYGVHIDGGIRRDSIWPTIAAIKLTIHNTTPCLVLHYSDIDNPEDYNVGTGVYSLFSSLLTILLNHINNINELTGLQTLLVNQYQEMLTFLLSQWNSIIDFLPTESQIKSNITSKYLAEISIGNKTNLNKIKNILCWPIIKDVPSEVQSNWRAKPLLKHDDLCYLFEQDILKGHNYYLSDNAGSGKPPTKAQLKGWINEQKQLFNMSPKLNPPIKFNMSLNDFPDTGNNNGRCHLTTAKNIVYLYDSWNYLIITIKKAYPRLRNYLKNLKNDTPVFVYVSNSIKPGRLFGDPFTGQLAAFSTAFGKFHEHPRKVIAYFPHQVHTQAINNGNIANNKGITLMSELTDCIIFYGGVMVNLSKGEIY